ncbi:MAG: J domain-containing protein [Campylobacterales bacterium]|nr:J domain-containing protein [Campylobacterales bacterium]
MIVSLHPSEIRIQIKEGSLHHKIIDNFVQKYFSNVLSLSSTTIIYHKKQEISKKKYFLNWLHSAYQKVNKEVEDGFLNQLQDNLNLPIRIKISGKKNILHGIKLKISFPHKNIMRLNVDALNDVPKTYFTNIFKKNLIDVYENQVDIQTTVSSVTELRKLLDRDKVLGLPITFIYNKVTIKKLFGKLDAKLRLKNGSKTRFKSRKQTNNHVPITQEYQELLESYKILECKQEDSKAVIKRKYLKLAKEYHPDKVYGQTEDIIKDYTEKFQKIRDAYSIIQNNIEKREVA